MLFYGLNKLVPGWVGIGSGLGWHWFQVGLALVPGLDAKFLLKIWHPNLEPMPTQTWSQCQPKPS